MDRCVVSAVAAGTGTWLERSSSHWALTDRDNCTCPPSLAITAHLVLASGQRETLSRPAKQCELPMQRQRLPTLRMLSSNEDTPAYTAFEIDSGTYGRLADLREHSHHNPVQPAMFVDVGANLGLMSISLALAHPLARVLALEPNPVTFALLQRNLEANGVADRVTALNAGLSADGQPLAMPRCVAAARGGSPMASTQWKGNRSAIGCKSSGCRVQADLVARCVRHDPTMLTIPSLTPVRLFEHLAQRRVHPRGWSGRVDALKLDCEGCEHQVLPLLPADGRVARIVGECHPHEAVSSDLMGLCWWYVMSRKVHFPLARATANSTIEEADPAMRAFLARSRVHAERRAPGPGVREGRGKV